MLKEHLRQMGRHEVGGWCEGLTRAEHIPLDCEQVLVADFTVPILTCSRAVLAKSMRRSLMMKSEDTSAGFEQRRVVSWVTVGDCLNLALAVFFGRLLLSVAANPRMLFPKYGRYHRLLGMSLLVYLMVGLVDARPGLPRLVAPEWRLAYDAGISVLGLAVTYSAAHEFGSAPVHKRRGEASGILDEASTVSESESASGVAFRTSLRFGARTRN